MRLVATALLVSSAVYLGLGGRRQEAGGRRQGGGGRRRRKEEVGKSQPAERQQLTQLILQQSLFLPPLPLLRTCPHRACGRVLNRPVRLPAACPVCWLLLPRAAL